MVTLRFIPAQVTKNVTHKKMNKHLLIETIKAARGILDDISIKGIQTTIETKRTTELQLQKGNQLTRVEIKIIRL